MDFLRVKSSHPNTEFAPTWDFPIGFKQWQDFDKIDTIRNWLLANEQRFINSYPAHHDGGTSLGTNSVTARHGMYNLFEFANELPEILDLLHFFRLSYLTFIEHHYARPRDSYIVSWFNIARKGESIAEHGHGASESSYLSGNMHLDSYKTINTYRSPYDERSCITRENIKGGLTLFPSSIPHFSSVYLEDSPRVSIAFDLRIHPTKNHLGFGLESTKFMDYDILQPFIQQG